MPVSGPKPPWLRVRLPAGGAYQEVNHLLAGLGLHTVCQEAQCPNKGECFHARTATFLILGDVCTRGCRFCVVAKGQPKPLDSDEPERVAKAVAALNLRYAVITSVTRDDAPDGGATIFADTVRAIRRRVPGCKVEVLIPDFQGLDEALRAVMDARPDVLNHNLETVPRLYATARPGADYARSLRLLRRAKELSPDGRTKTGLMLGLGETLNEVRAVMADLVAVGCDLLTLGQYLQPSHAHLPVERYVPPEEFATLARVGEALGLRHVEAGPLVRSSYHAREQVEAMEPQTKHDQSH
jgi:lipoic acid synthetase